MPACIPFSPACPASASSARAGSWCSRRPSSQASGTRCGALEAPRTHPRMLLALDVADADEICLVVNDAAAAYRGVIPADRWKEPYMPLEEVHEEIGAGVVFWGYRRGGRFAGVMGLQQVHDVALIRRSEEHTSELQAPCNLGCRLLLEKKKN